MPIVMPESGPSPMMPTPSWEPPSLMAIQIISQAFLSPYNVPDQVLYAEKRKSQSLPSRSSIIQRRRWIHTQTTVIQPNNGSIVTRGKEQILPREELAEALWRNWAFELDL